MLGPVAPSGYSNTNHIITFPVKPRIDRTNLKAVAVRAGKPILFDVNVKGEPAPKVQWFQKWKADEKEVRICWFFGKLHRFSEFLDLTLSKIERDRRRGRKRQRKSECEKSHLNIRL